MSSLGDSLTHAPGTVAVADSANVVTTLAAKFTNGKLRSGGSAGVPTGASSAELSLAYPSLISALIADEHTKVASAISDLSDAIAGVHTDLSALADAAQAAIDDTGNAAIEAELGDVPDGYATFSAAITAALDDVATATSGLDTATARLAVLRNGTPSAYSTDNASYTISNPNGSATATSFIFTNDPAEDQIASIAFATQQAPAYAVAVELDVTATHGEVIRAQWVDKSDGFALADPVTIKDGISQLVSPLAKYIALEIEIQDGGEEGQDTTISIEKAFLRYEW